MQSQDDMYREKYLKYKAKYLELKQEGGLLTFKNGIFAFFCSSDVANQICSTIHGKSPSVAQLNQILESYGNTYRGKNGDRELTIVKRSSMKRLQDNAGRYVSKGAKAITTGAKATGHFFAQGARNTGNFFNRGAHVTGAYVSNAAGKAGNYFKNNVLPAPKRRINIDNIEQDPTNQAGGDPFDIVSLPQPLETNNHGKLVEIANKLQRINPAINTIVIIDLKTMGTNTCINKIHI